MGELLNNVIFGNNTVSFRSGNDFILYEQLLNTIHSGDFDTIKDLAAVANNVTYFPMYENYSLKKSKSSFFESLLLNVTEDCNIGCKYCVFGETYYGGRSQSKNVMSIDTARRAVDMFVPFSKTDNILMGFYGGEPLTNFLLIRDVVVYSKQKFPEKNFIFSLTTNFVDTENILDFFVEHNIFANISLDGPQLVHDKYRVTKNNKPTYNLIMKNISSLEKLCPGYVSSHIGLNATCNASEDFPLIVNDFIDKNDDFTNMRVGLVEQKGLKHKNNISTIDHLLNYADIYIDYLISGSVPPKVLQRFFDESVKNIYTRSLKSMPDSLMLSGACYPGNRKIFVDTDGSIFMCEKFGGRQKIGSIELGISEHLVNRSIDTFTDIRNNYCSSSNCWAKRLCTPCIHTAKDADMDISVYGLSQNCQSMKLDILLGISIYTKLLSKKPEILNNYFDSQLDVAI